MAGDRPSNADLLYLIALHLRIVNGRTGALEPRYERLLNPPVGNPMTATEWRAKNEPDNAADPLASNPSNVVPNLRGDESPETLADMAETAEAAGVEFPPRDHLMRPTTLEAPEPPEEESTTRRGRGRRSVGEHEHEGPHAGEHEHAEGK